MLRLNNVTAGYGATTILHDVSLEVSEGEVVTIVGGNGAGKTTTLRTVSGLIEASAGSITFEGEDITHLPAHQVVNRGITLIPEARQLFPEMTVLENIQMGAYRSAAKSRYDQRLEEVLTLFPRVKERLHQQAESLSGGEQQMVAIARGMMACPKLLMFDEPSLGLAPIVVSQVFDVVKKIAESGTTVLIVEQNVNQTLKVADRAYVIENGRMVMDGQAQELMGDDHIRKAYLGI
ncbi:MULTISPECIES: ABC transporter ATP-binding protein [Halomonadaceae]|uniref:ABC transporter ATP-binding protein n=1 Tax=Halomonas marinisediminis TaxID=2546095 RepID=A0ABY2D9E9_9GAMM|nr:MULTISPECIES: ABC transporter ATP-binding protein [Halomonas]MCD1652098.1 ABC transporter ATP-binding protein [Halomonas axialensis]MCD2088295.1 ABC transporter ATP-binding protein [Halomonas meridiana]TDB04663.1 ABC transporter ATP-binding protein [Halomonas marinisediminis]